MANEEHLKILNQGVEAWNKWREENPDIEPNLIGAYLSNAKLNEANFSKSNLTKSILRNCSLVGADLIEADLTEADLTNSDLRRANLIGSKLCGADLRDANLGEARMPKTNFSKANLRGAQFREANLIKSNLCKANLIKAKLYKARLSEANLTGAFLNGAYLSRANLIGADLSGADLIKAYLIGADLREVDLSGANLVESYLSGANLSDANLSQADISGAILYASARDNWIIDGIKCKFIYWDKKGKKRFPEEREFELNEFEELYKQLPTIEYYFEHSFTPIDAFVMDQVVQAIDKKHSEFELRLDSFHSRGKPHAVFTVLHENFKEEAFNQIKLRYETRIAKLEAERDALEKCFNRALEEPRTIIKRIEMGDKYNIKGQTGAVGPGAHAHDINFNQLWNRLSSEIDSMRLSEELTQLRLAMKKEAETLEHDTAVGEIAAAEAAAQADDGPKALVHLKRAGKWALGVAENIGTTIAAEALKKAMGL